MAGYIPYNQNQSFSATQYFPQPQGNVYMVNNSLEVSNIPMGAGISVVLCPSEGTMYIKTLQGGAPTLMVYTIAPFEQKEKNAIHAEGEQTRALINANTMQELRDRLEDRDRQLMTANFQLSQQSQTAALVNELRPCSKPAYITCSPYAAANPCGCCGI